MKLGGGLVPPTMSSTARAEFFVPVAADLAPTVSFEVLAQDG